MHTGQHYDLNMSDVFFEDLGIPAPDVHLAVGSGTHGRQTGAMLVGMDEVLEQHTPDWVLVYGDTNSTVAGALSAVKMHIPLAHLEAGLRSFNRRMPEEHNRVLTDHAADLCLAPTEVAMAHLAAEGLTASSVLVGDVMTDVLLTVCEAVAARDAGTQRYFYSSSAHPRLRARAAEQGLDLTQGAVVAADPLPYPALVRAAMSSAGVITDSGGLQKESFLLRVPCTTVRTETEWTETVDLGWNVLAADVSMLAKAVTRPAPEPTDAAPYGDGHAAERAVAAIAAATQR